MCGIAGTLGFEENRRDRVARSMLDSLARRGPDDEGQWSDGPLTLLHRRLSIIDPSAAGHQPILDASGRFAMVFNGEIYNHRELRAQYLTGLRFRGESDSETLIELYARHGADCLAFLNGIFAMGIWDRKDRSLLLARDGAGVKPLYCWRPSADKLAFASELKALQTIDSFSSSLDPVAAAAYVTYLYSPGERTMFADVRKHPAGVWRRFDLSGRQVEEGRFYHLPDYHPEKMSPQEAISRTYRELGDAVGRQMLADVEVGAFLSGGLDSTSICHFARQHATKPLRCFTLRYDEEEASQEMVADLPYAREAASHLGVNLREVTIDPRLTRDLPVLVEMLDEPQADPAALCNYFISRAAQEAGVKVLLGGAGGDDIFTGYRRHQIAARDRTIALVPEKLRTIALQASLAIPSSNGKLQRLRKGLGAMQGHGDERLLRAFEWLPVERSADLLQANVDESEVTAPFVNVLGSIPPTNAIEKMLRLEQTFFLRDHNLNYTDKTGMAASVEVRVPFLDKKLMNFAATIPTNLKLRKGQTKWVLRKAMEAHLPHAVIYRPKTGFGVPLRSWLRGPMRDTIFDLTSRNVVTARGLFEPTHVERLRGDHFSGRIDGAYPLLSLALIELWCRRFA